ncbi:MAG: hypothetical protein FWF59_04315 [Turicibacter sp.]|nr:hypothetical protein [Turicibacter sp.]
MLWEKVKYKLWDFFRTCFPLLLYPFLFDVLLPILENLFSGRRVQREYLFITVYAQIVHLTLFGWGYFQVSESRHLFAQFSRSRKQDFQSTVIALVVISLPLTWLRGLGFSYLEELQDTYFHFMRELFIALWMGGLGILAVWLTKKLATGLRLALYFLLINAVMFRLDKMWGFFDFISTPVLGIMLIATFGMVKYLTLKPSMGGEWNV